MSAASLKNLSVNLIKGSISNDIRFLSSGPHAGLNELLLPNNEPGSSIMPGKVNPTQCEALSMVCIQILGLDLSVSIGASQGNFQLNNYQPLMAFNVLTSIRLLTDALNSFKDKCLKGIKANKQRIKEYLENNLILATALNPHIGYDKAAQIVKMAVKEKISLKESAIKSGFVTKEQFEKWVKPEDMIKIS